MVAAKSKEHALLRGRLVLLQHIEDFLHKGNLFKKERPQVMANVKAILDAGLELPYDLRLKMLQRHTEDCFREIKARGDPESRPTALVVAQWVRIVAVWEMVEKNAAINELNPTFRWVLDTHYDSLHYNLKFKSLSREDFRAQVQQHYEEPRSAGWLPPFS